MKKLFTLSVLLLLAGAVCGQSPLQFNYQAVLRGPSGSVEANQDFTIDVAILGEDMATILFTEQHLVTSNEYGMVNLTIGSVGDLGAIDWGSENYFLEIRVDGEVLSTTQLLSVPYAMHANTAERVLGDSLWKQKNGNIYFNNGSLGIGTDIPAGRISVLNDDLAQEEGSRINWMRLYGKAYNGDNLYLFHRRHTAGDNWNSSEVVIQKQVDSTPMHYISFKGEEANKASLEFGYSDVPYMTITKTGNIGIGVSDPDVFALTISGGLKVNDNIIVDGMIGIGKLPAYPVDATGTINAQYNGSGPAGYLGTANYGVQGSSSHTGIYGSGSLIGVRGYSNSGTGVLGQSLTGLAGHFDGNVLVEDEVEIKGSLKLGTFGIDSMLVISGTTSSTGFSDFALPQGWNFDNTFVISCHFEETSIFNSAVITREPSSWAEDYYEEGGSLPPLPLWKGSHYEIAYLGGTTYVFRVYYRTTSPQSSYTYRARQFNALLLKIN